MDLRRRVTPMLDQFAFVLGLVVMFAVALVLICCWLAWLLLSLPVYALAVIGLGRTQRDMLIQVMQIIGPKQDRETSDADDINIMHVARAANASFMDAYDQLVEGRRKHRFRLLYQTCHSGVSAWRIRLIRFLPVPL